MSMKRGWGHRFTLLPLLAIGMALMFVSCFDPTLSMTDEEEEFAESLEGLLNCSATIEKDWDVVVEGKKDHGTMWLAINCSDTVANQCGKDSVRLFHLSRFITERLEEVMADREMYDTLIVAFSTDRRIDSRSSVPVCERTFVFDLNTDSLVQRNW